MDRSVPPTVARALTTFNDFHAVPLDVMYYPHGPNIEDVQWLRDSGHHGWLSLTANERIWRDDSEREAIVDWGARVFSFNNSQLLIQAQGMVVGRWMLSIRRRAKRRDPCFWRIGYNQQPLKDLP